MRWLLELEPAAIVGARIGLVVAPLTDGSGGIAFGGVRTVADGARFAAVILPSLLRVDCRLEGDLIRVQSYNLAPQVPMRDHFVDVGSERGIRIVDVWTAWAAEDDPLVSRTRLGILDEPELAAHHVVVRGSAWPAQARRFDNGPWFLADEAE